MRELLARIDSVELSEWIARDLIANEDEQRAKLSRDAQFKLEGRVSKRKRR